MKNGKKWIILGLKIETLEIPRTYNDERRHEKFDTLLPPRK